MYHCTLTCTIRHALRPITAARMVRVRLQWIVADMLHSYLLTGLAGDSGVTRGFLRHAAECRQFHRQSFANVFCPSATNCEVALRMSDRGRCLESRRHHHDCSTRGCSPNDSQAKPPPLTRHGKVSSSCFQSTHNSIILYSNFVARSNVNDCASTK